MRKRVIVELARIAADAADLIASPAREDLPGLSIDTGFEPVPLAAAVDQHGVEAGTESRPETLLIRGEIEEEDQAALAAAPQVLGVWTDAQVEAFSSGCGCGSAAGDSPWAPETGLGVGADAPMGGDVPSALDLLAQATTAGDLPAAFALATASPCIPVDCDYRTAKGSIADVAHYLGCDGLWSMGVRGRGVVVGVVDTGIDASKVPNVIGGWTPNPAWPPGQDPGGHGSMCGTDVLGMAPEAKLYDIGVLKSTGDLKGLLSDAIAGYQWALNQFRADGTPQILTNSWGIYQESWAPDYARDANHPFTRKAVEVIGAGILVAFAAGNCGQVCPSGSCGADNGPGKSIWGANGHPAVITVGAANIRGEWIGYTSQGPAALDPRKPDFCAPSHFKGFTACDNGTSAATPVCAGVLALLRGHDPQLTQARAKDALQATATTLCGPGWDAQSGFGIINAGAAYNKLFLFETVLRQSSWIHGTSVEVEVPGDLVSSRRFGFYALYEGKPGTANWFHFAIPTPVIVAGRRLRLDSVMTRLLTDPDVTVTNVDIYDGEAKIQAYDGLSLTGARWFDRFDVLNRSVSWGVGISIRVQFGSASGPHRIGFISAGGDFID